MPRPTISLRGRRAPVPGLGGVCAALLPPEVGGPESGALAARVESFAARLPTEARAGLRGAAAVLQATALATERRGLARLDAEARHRVVERVARTELGGSVVDALKAVVLLVDGADRYADDLVERSSREPPARPDGVLDVTPATSWPALSYADAVVVGSGAGGAMVARTLARAGMNVVVIEEGRRFTVEEFRTRHPLDRFSELYRGGGASVALGRPPVVLPVGRGVGGTTLVNSGTCYRTPPAVLERWRAAGLALADAAEFSGHLDEVERTLQVAPVPDEVMGDNGRLALAGARALGWSAGPLRRNAPGCGGCCQCAIGCPRNAKLGVHLSVLPDAVVAGARIVSEARVDRVLVEEGRALGVRARDGNGATIEIRAPIVVVAAGTTETPGLLRRSGIGRHRQLGRNMALHPAVGVAGLFDEPVTAWKGVLQSAAVDEFHESDGILVEATATPPGMGSVNLPGSGPPLVELIERADHLATLGAMVADRPRGRVLGRSRAMLGYQLDRDDGRRLLKAVAVMGKVLLAAGATRIYTPLATTPEVTTVDQLDELAGNGAPARLHVAAFHPTGTARAGADPASYPVDPEGRLRGVTGVRVADASVLPSCPEVNPQVSVMAVALALGQRIAADGA